MSESGHASATVGQRLRALPAEAAAPYDWAEFERRRGAARAGARRCTLVQWSAVLAAALLAAVVGAAWWQRDAGEVAGIGAASQAAARAPARRDARRAEEWLAQLPAEPALVSVETHAAVALLEDRIAWVDDVLSHESIEGGPPAHIAALQRERAQLMDALVQVRYAESLAAVAR